MQPDMPIFVCAGDVLVGLSLWGNDEASKAPNTPVSTPNSSIEVEPPPELLPRDASVASSVDSAHYASSYEDDNSPLSSGSNGKAKLRHRINNFVTAGGHIKMPDVKLPRMASSQSKSARPAGANDLAVNIPSVAGIGSFNVPSPKFGGSASPSSESSVKGPPEPPPAGSLNAAAATGGSAGGGASNEVPLSFFEEDLKAVPSPGPLPDTYAGGLVVDQVYGVPARDMNALIFKPDSDFWADWTSGGGNACE